MNTSEILHHPVGLGKCCVHPPTPVSRTRFKNCGAAVFMDWLILEALKYPTISFASPWTDVVYSNVLMS